MLNAIRTKVRPQEIRNRSVLVGEEMTTLEIIHEDFDPKTETYTLQIGFLLPRQPRNVSSKVKGKIASKIDGVASKPIDYLLTQGEFDRIILPLLPIKIRPEPSHD